MLQTPGATDRRREDPMSKGARSVISDQLDVDGDTRSNTSDANQRAAARWFADVPTIPPDALNSVQHLGRRVPLDPLLDREPEAIFARLKALEEQLGDVYFKARTDEAAARVRDLIEFIDAYNRTRSIAGALDAAGIANSSSTLMRRLDRYRAFGPAGLIDLSGAPRTMAHDAPRRARKPLREIKKERRGSFLRWMGGKGKLAERICQLFPTDINRYYEPMVGAGSVFLKLKPSRAVIGDINRELVDTWRVLQREPDALISALLCMEVSHEDYLRMRTLDPWQMTPVERAARMIYLNQTGFNGMYRVNRFEQFNVPYGGDRPLVVRRDLFERLSAQIAEVEIRDGDFEEVCADAGKGDLVYFDPPYLNRKSATATTFRFDKTNFDIKSHQRLAAFANQLALRGVRVFVSHFQHPEIQALYPDSTPHALYDTELASGGTKSRLRKELVYELPTRDT